MDGLLDGDDGEVVTDNRELLESYLAPTFSQRGGHGMSGECVSGMEWNVGWNVCEHLKDNWTISRRNKNKA